jgi:hypothetical protein
MTRILRIGADNTRWNEIREDPLNPHYPRSILPICESDKVTFSARRQLLVVNCSLLIALTCLLAESGTAYT